MLSLQFPVSFYLFFCQHHQIVYICYLIMLLLCRLRNFMRTPYLSRINLKRSTSKAFECPLVRSITLQYQLVHLIVQLWVSPNGRQFFLYCGCTKYLRILTSQKGEKLYFIGERKKWLESFSVGYQIANKKKRKKKKKEKCYTPSNSTHPLGHLVADWCYHLSAVSF